MEFFTFNGFASGRAFWDFWSGQYIQSYLFFGLFFASGFIKNDFVDVLQFGDLVKLSKYLGGSNDQPKFSGMGASLCCVLFLGVVKLTDQLNLRWSAVEETLENYVFSSSVNTYIFIYTSLYIGVCPDGLSG